MPDLTDLTLPSKPVQYLWELACQRKGRYWHSSFRIRQLSSQPLAAIAVTSTRMPSTASAATPTAARTGQGLLKKR